MARNILVVLSSGIVLFFWGYISWAVLPWHDMVANQFTDESAVMQILMENAPVAGVYMLPFAEQDYVAGEPTAFVNVVPDGMDMNMGALMVTALLGQMMAALLVLVLLRNTCGLGYWQRVGFVVLVGLAVGFISHFQYWNWFGFSTPYVLVTILDSTIAWLLAGLIMAGFVGGQRA